MVKILNTKNKFTKDAPESDSEEEDVKTAADSEDLKGTLDQLKLNNRSHNI